MQAQGFRFELKGATSLSKGFGVIHRFSEDIDIRVDPPASMAVKIGRNQDKPVQAYDMAATRGVKAADNRAQNVACYAPTYTFVEKLQTISTKYRRIDEAKAFPGNFLRHYYDVYCLLGLEEVRAFLGQPAYEQHKRLRFRAGDERVIARNAAFLLEDKAQRRRFEAEYAKTAALYYQGQPAFEDMLARIGQHLQSM